MTIDNKMQARWCIRQSARTCVTMYLLVENIFNVVENMYTNWV